MPARLNGRQRVTQSCKGGAFHMQTADDWRAAIAAGVVDAATADRLAAFFDARDKTAAGGDAEAIRFVRGLGDIFLAIGLGILLVGLGIGGFMLLGLPAGALPAAVAAWLLAWWLVRDRRTTLPGIVLAAAFAIGVGFFAAGFFGGLNDLGYLSTRAMDETSLLPALIALGLAAAVAALTFYLRFRLPVAFGGIAFSLAFALFFTLLCSGAQTLGTEIGMLAGGLVLFLAAMAFDLTDPRRIRIASDNAFWIHLVAAPLIVHTVMSLATGVPRSDAFGTGDALVVVAIVVVLGIVAVVVDRRAMLIAGLVYLGAAIGQLLYAAKLDVGAAVPLTLVIVGGLVVGLVRGWIPARRVLIRLVPAGLARRLPPVAA